MRAIVITEPGPPENLKVVEVPTPTPRPGEVLVRVRATALNRADLLQRRGLYPAPTGISQEIPGLEFAGEVEDTPAASSAWEPGQRVMGLLAGGGYAEYVVVPSEHLLPVPEVLDWFQAAAIPEAYLTAFDAMCLQGRLRAGETVLVHAIASGVGCAALQLARQLSATVVGTSRNPKKLAILQSQGLDCAIDSSRQKFAEAVADFTGGQGVDLILDLIGGDHFDENFAALHQQGRIVVVGLVAGREARLDLGTLLRKRILLRGTVLRSRSNQEKAELIAAFGQTVLPQFEGGFLRPIVDRIFPFSEVAAAHRYMEENLNLGKIVLSVEE